IEANLLYYSTAIISAGDPAARYTALAKLRDPAGRPLTELVENTVLGRIGNAIALPLRSADRLPREWQEALATYTTRPPRVNEVFTVTSQPPRRRRGSTSSCQCPSRSRRGTRNTRSTPPAPARPACPGDGGCRPACRARARSRSRGGGSARTGRSAAGASRSAPWRRSGR